jgi:hypothetical protein
MLSIKRIGLVGAVTMLAALTTAVPTVARKASTKPPALANAHALLVSRELWATIDVCSPVDQPDTVGVRGSMPGDGHATDKMYMSFRLQYMSAAKQWVDLESAVPVFGAVGGGAAAREGGSSFQLVPVVGKPATELRGVVDFQWRRGKRVLLSTSRPSTAGRKSVTGSDPAGFSAATCLIG